MIFDTLTIERKKRDSSFKLGFSLRYQHFYATDVTPISHMHWFTSPLTRIDRFERNHPNKICLVSLLKVSLNTDHSLWFQRHTMKLGLKLWDAEGAEEEVYENEDNGIDE